LADQATAGEWIVEYGMLDAHQLNVFLTAARSLNFTVAGRQLHMTQPSVSQHIQALEQHFEMPLFVRAGRHLQLTDAGAALMPLAQEMVAISQRIEETMVSLQGEVHGHLLVGCSTTVGKYILPFLLAAFLQEYPKVKATCYVTARHSVMEMLCDGDIHLGLASACEPCKDVEFRRFIADPVILISPLDHPWALRQEIEPEELLEADFIWREEGSGTRTVAAEGLQQLGLAIDELRTVLTLGNSEAIALAVQEGIGVGFISQLLVSRLVQGKVAPVKVRGLRLYQDIYIGCNTGRPATKAQTAFWSFVTDPHNPVLQKLKANGGYDEWAALTAVAMNERCHNTAKHRTLKYGQVMPVRTQK
jgi:DNA-binding transcriptional LysR family regulator